MISMKIETLLEERKVEQNRVEYKQGCSKKGGGKTDKTMCYWIRPGSLTTEARGSEVAELFEKLNTAPFDDRINRLVSPDIIRRGYLEDFLRESHSMLAEEIDTRTQEDMLLSLEVANETDTGIALRNIAVLMFADRPDKWIKGARINLVRFRTEDAEASDDFVEKTFTGPAKWIDMKQFESGKVRARKYRNRRIGEFLKELDLSEKQGTGIPKILRELKKNGSPPPKFETDPDRTYLITTISMREGFQSDQFLFEVEVMPDHVLSELEGKMTGREISMLRRLWAYLAMSTGMRDIDAAKVLGLESKAASRLLDKTVAFGVVKNIGDPQEKVYRIRDGVDRVVGE